jgi:ubiquinone/menaquinone biosynthesis C-methylase UbiE
MSKESYKPKAHTPPVGLFNTVRFSIRLVLDLQVISVYRYVKKFLNTNSGNLLDLGCGESPYRFLVNESSTKYYGVDIADADKFDYTRTDITHFDGKKIPFADQYFDSILCTEVVEHVLEYQTLIDDAHRVLKPGGKVLFTIPWSARYHYIPYDYFRYTPSTLKEMFKNFKSVSIEPRGTDVTAIASKLIVLYFRNVFPQEKWRYLFSPLWLILAMPFVILAVIFGQLSLLTKFGSDLDPIGYSILAEK